MNITIWTELVAEATPSFHRIFSNKNVVCSLAQVLTARLGGFRLNSFCLAPKTFTSSIYPDVSHLNFILGLREVQVRFEGRLRCMVDRHRAPFYCKETKWIYHYGIAGISPLFPSELTESQRVAHIGECIASGSTQSQLLVEHRLGLGALSRTLSDSQPHFLKAKQARVRRGRRATVSNVSTLLRVFTTTSRDSDGR